MKLLCIEEVAAKIKRSIGRTKFLATQKDFPPPREYGPHGRQYYAAEDISFWQRTRVDGRKVRRKIVTPRGR